MWDGRGGARRLFLISALAFVAGGPRGRPGLTAPGRALRPGAAWAGDAAPRPETERIQPRSGQAFDVLAHRGAGDGRRAAVLVLGGSKGYASGSYGLLASALNRAGLDAYLIEYLTADDRAAIEGAGSARARLALYAGHLAAWTEAARATMESLRRGAVPPTGFGVIGISLGAMPALSACAGGGIGALAIVDGSLPDSALARIRSLPPLLTVWGTGDAVFPVEVGAKLGGLARRLGGTSSSVTYDGRGHAFFVDPDDADAARARAAVAAFLTAHL